MSMQTAGYSGTPLVKKLGIKPGSRLLLVQAPGQYPALLAPLPDDVEMTCITDGLKLVIPVKQRAP